MKTPFKKVRKIAITTGDRDGIGFEISVKALLQKKISLKSSNAVYFLFRHQEQEIIQPRYFKSLDKHCTRYTFSSLHESISFLSSLDNLKQVPDNVLIDLCLKTNEAQWVYEAAVACKEKRLNSLVTGPLSKKTGARLSKKPLGHTGIFRQLFPESHLNMAFVGKHFNVILATDHIPFSRIEGRLISGDFKKSLKNALAFKKTFKLENKIGVLGLNPHAGESGLLGSTEKKLFKNLNSKNFEGPLVPDAAFLRKNWKKYSLFFCLYHDQGLIPFKSQHGQDSGVHITMGLPFLRTSVDHGTAFDLFNKDSANPASMLDAINLNLKLTGVTHV